MKQKFDSRVSISTFICPNCKVLATHSVDMYVVNEEPKSAEVPDEYSFHFKYGLVKALCTACELHSIWLKREISMTRSFGPGVDSKSPKDNFEYEQLLYPLTNSEVESPNEDMPEKIKEIYREASLVLDYSPRASAALSRLAIQELVDELVQGSGKLNTKIGKLVSKGLPVTIQQMLDSVRVIGNNAVHPGQIDIKDNKDLAITLLSFINLIVDNQITQPNKINEIYQSLPQSALDGINNRDKH